VSEYRDILDSYWDSFSQAHRVLRESLKEPIVIGSRVEGEPPLKVYSVSSLYSVSVGVRLKAGHVRFMRVCSPPGWVRGDGVFVDHNEVYRRILWAADSGGTLTISR